MIRITDFLFPPKCICCGELLTREFFDGPFCAVCAGKFELAKKRCRIENNGRPVRKIESIGDGGTHEFVPYSFVYTSGKRHTPENTLIFCLKNTIDKRAILLAASEFAAIVKDEVPFILVGSDGHSNAIITWIPRSRASVRKIGFDHMERVAKALSNRLCIPSMPLVKRTIVADEQKHLDSKARKINAQRTMKITKATELKGKTVLLIDDIVTTGASISTAAKLLLESGASQVIPAVLSAAERPLEMGKRRIEDNFNIIKK